MEKYLVNQVFTPASIAKYTFIEREDKVNTKLVDALNTPGMQIVLYGHSGCGKTTLLINKLNHTYEDHIITRCMEGMTFDSIIFHAFDMLNKFYVETSQISKENTNSASITASYIAIKGSLNAEIKTAESVTSKRIMPIQLTPQRLAQFIGEANCCWVLEDFHNVNSVEKRKVSQLMKIFMDSASDYPNLKIIAIGAVDTAKEVIEYNSEMKNRVREIYVPLMNNQEIAKIIYKGEELLNISFRPRVVQDIISYSSGLPSICHSLCLSICNLVGLVETSEKEMIFTDEEFSKAVDSYVEANSDTFKSVIDKALKVHRVIKYENAKIILNSMLNLNKDEISPADILKDIHTTIPEYPSSNLGKFLKLLTLPERGEILIYNINSNKYSFSTPFLKAFTYCILKPISRESKILETEKLINDLILKFSDKKTNWLFDVKKK
jgi:GTPase SAR1 family protein